MANLSKASNVVRKNTFCGTLLALLKSGIRFLSQPTVDMVTDSSLLPQGPLVLQELFLVQWCNVPSRNLSSNN